MSLYEGFLHDDSIVVTTILDKSRQDLPDPEEVPLAGPLMALGTGEGRLKQKVICKKMSRWQEYHTRDTRARGSSWGKQQYTSFMCMVK